MVARIDYVSWMVFLASQFWIWDFCIDTNLFDVEEKLMEKKILFGMLPFILCEQLGQNILYNESLYRMYGMLNVKGGVQKVLFSQDKLQRIIPEDFLKSL